MNLDKTWEQKADSINELDDFDAPGDYYLQGASDFQEKLIKIFEKAKGSKVGGEIALQKEYVINEIKNLKAE